MANKTELAEMLNKLPLQDVGIRSDQAIQSALARAGQIQFQHPTFKPIDNPISGDWSLFRQRIKERGNT